MCSTSIKVGHLRAGEVSSRVLGNDEMLQNIIPNNQGISTYRKLEKQADQGKWLILKTFYWFLSLKVLLYSQVLRLSDHENKRFYNDEEDITFVPENSLKSIRKKNHRKRYKKKHGNQQYRKWSEKPNNVSAFLFKFV